MTDRNLYRYLFLSLLTGLLMFSTTGCSDSIPVQEAGDVTSRASLAVDVQGVSTTVPTDGNYDTYIETLRVIGFDASGNVLCNKRYANNSVGGNGLTVTDGQFQLTQPLDGAFQGGTCRFYFVANEEYYTLYQTNRRLSDYLANPALAEADLKNCVIAYAPTPDRISGSYPILMTAVSEPQLVRPGMNRMEAVSLMRSLVKVQLQVLKGAAVTDGVTVSEVKLQGTYPDSYSLWNTRDYTGYTSQPMDVDLFSTDPNRPFIGPVMYLPEKMMRGQSTDQDLKFTFLLASGALTSRYELGIGAGNGDGITDYALYRNNRYQTTATFNGWKKLMNLSFTVARLAGTEYGTVVLNDGSVDNVQLDAVLSRAAAKVVVTLTPDVGKGVSFPVPGEGIYYNYQLVNMRTDTRLLAEGGLATNPKLAGTDPTQANLTAPAADRQRITFFTYTYSHSWENTSLAENITYLVVKVPITQTGSDNSVTSYVENYYKIPVVTSENAIARNTCYNISANIGAAGATDVSQVEILEGLNYQVLDWIPETIGVGDVTDKPKFLYVNKHELV